MTLKRVLVYKGKTSQTGIAASKRFPGLCAEGSRESFEEIAEIITEEQSLAFLPLWNSHAGEITRTTALEMAFMYKVKIQDLWPTRIKFECIGRKGASFKKVKKILVVFAAKAQCSKFLKKFTCEDRDSTVDSYREFLRDTSFDAVLCAPRQWDKEKCIKFKDDVSNPYNFTTFILLGNINIDIQECKAKRWVSLIKYGIPKNFIIFGVDMPLPVPTLTEEQQDFFDDLTKDSMTIDEIPRIIFIFRIEASRCGILMESKLHSLSLSAQEDGYLPDIVVKGDLGETNKQYTDTMITLLKTEFSDFFFHDFVKHLGTNTCLYTCSELNIMVHGFDPEVVEVVVRRIINKYFELIDNGLSCSDSQKKLFNKYKKDYYSKGSQFIDFVQV